KTEIQSICNQIVKETESDLLLLPQFTEKYIKHEMKEIEKENINLKLQVETSTKLLSGKDAIIEKLSTQIKETKNQDNDLEITKQQLYLLEKKYNNTVIQLNTLQEQLQSENARLVESQNKLNQISKEYELQQL